MKYTKEQLQNKFEALPKDIKEAISSLETSNIIVDIGEKYKLHVDQIGGLIDEVGLLMLGFKNSVDFIGSLSSETDIPQEKVSGIVDEINDKILSKIEPFARKIHEARLEKKEKEDILKPAETVNSFGEVEKAKEEKLEKNKILDEIENPKKIENNFSNINDVDFKEKSEEEKVADKKEDFSNAQNLKNQLDNNEEKVKDDIVENKLTKVTVLSPEEKEIQVDPYREPIK